ncbi:leukocyte cell-derived chemotaxin 1 [Callorhinchus milii]|uniref:Leukocyte cell-derived chemotaxin 1 n=1 Tax=Callorhinchus milii TaxID=7868 RepID=V9KQP6_CALMI|nr:leukocyte cell-derived chemotaxin 1 [Callorhinchus milii]|eukprot:gi/632952066/ref/XP_007891647.1/ PREDICTED: leukocyte cell-derived chemotaxin 1 [Callorhinchus milii]
MAETSEKVPIALAGPADVEQCLPPAYTVAVKSSSSGRLLKIGAVVLITGAALLVLGAIGAFYFWKINDKNVYNMHYTMSINGKVKEGSLEIDTENNLETFRTGSGNEEAVEVHDFQTGITGIHFAGGEKCYIKAQAKAHLPDIESLKTEAVSFELEDEIMPAKFEEESLIWVAAEQPVKDHSFLSPKILELCSDLPIYWLRPTYTKEEQRKKRSVARERRQLLDPHYDGDFRPAVVDEYDQIEGAPEEVDVEVTDIQPEEAKPEGTVTAPEEEGSPSAFNAENPYHRLLQGEGGMTFDPMLDHQGICCAECRRSYTHCQRICEPLGGYMPWPYDYRGCRVACTMIMPCTWWVGRILGVL